MENDSLADQLGRGQCPFHMNVSWAESIAGVELSAFPAGSTGQGVASERIMRGIRVFWLVLVLAAVPTAASAVTLDQVVALRKAGVTDAVILALIERDRTVFSIQPEQIVELQRAGLSEALIIAMLKSGQAAEDAIRAESAYTSAMIAAALGRAPDLVVVGHGPERPNTYHADGFFSNSSAGPFVIPPYFGSAAPYAVPRQGRYLSSDRRDYNGPRGDRWTQPRALCYAQVQSSVSAGNSLTYVTECPAVMQPRRRR
jgi:hypothetical protein